MKQKAKNPNYHALPSLDNGAASALASRRVLLCGESVFATLGAGHAPTKGFLPQPARETVTGFFRQFEKTTTKLNLWIDERLLGLKKARFAFAIDGYIAWGLRQRRKGVLVLLGGAPAARQTNVEILVFVDGRLVAVNEKVLPGIEEPAFTDTRDTLLADLRGKYPTARFVQAAPLSNWGLDAVEFVGDAPLRGLSYKPIGKLVKQRSALSLPAMVVTAGIFIYITFFMVGWGRYSDAMAGYKAAIQDPAIHENGGIDTNFLNTMNSRRIYMETPRRQGFLVDKAEKVIRGIASVDRVKVLQLRLPAPSVNPQVNAGVAISPDADVAKRQISPDRSPDVWVSLSVPKTEVPAIAQGKHAVLEGIARNTGMSVRIAQQGIREDKGQRVYDIEGFFHD